MLFRSETAQKGAANEPPKFGGMRGRGGGPGGRGRGGGRGGAAGGRKESKDKKSGKKGGKKSDGVILPTSVAPGDGDKEKGQDAEEEKPFALNGIKLTIPKGSFVAIVGRVGSGKVCICTSIIWHSVIHLPQSSLLQALIGEMRKSRGEVRTRSPCPCACCSLLFQ